MILWQLKQNLVGKLTFKMQSHSVRCRRDPNLDSKFYQLIGKIHLAVYICAVEIIMNIQFLILNPCEIVSSKINENFVSHSYLSITN